MIALLKDWKGEVEVNDERYEDGSKLAGFKPASGQIHIKLYSANKNACKSVVDRLQDELQYRITVKRYMTEKSSAGFDFMAKFNNDNPMPLRTMIGTIEKETRGMVYMKLHGQAEPVIKCMRCGRTLTNPISMKYGIGPECITKVPFIMDLDINDVDGIKKKLVDVKWEGWIIKSAITEKEEVEND